MRNTDRFLFDTGIPPDNSEDFRGLAGKHGADVEFEGHFFVKRFEWQFRRNFAAARLALRTLLFNGSNFSTKQYQ